MSCHCCYGLVHFQNKQTHILLKELLSHIFLPLSSMEALRVQRGSVYLGLDYVIYWRKGKWAFLLPVEFSRQAHTCRNRLEDVLHHRNICTHSSTGAVNSSHSLSDLEKAVLESSMSMPIKPLVELVFLMLCVPWNMLLLHAGVYLWRQQSFWIGTVTRLGEL